MNNYIFNFKCTDKSINIFLNESNDNKNLLNQDYLKNIISCDTNEKQVTIFEIIHNCYENIIIPFSSSDVLLFFNNNDDNFSDMNKIKINDFFGLKSIARTVHKSYIKQIIENNYNANTIDKMIDKLNEDPLYNSNTMSLLSKDALRDNYVTFNANENKYVNSKIDFDTTVWSHLDKAFGDKYLWFYLDHYKMNINRREIIRQPDYCKYISSNYIVTNENDNLLDVIKKVMGISFFSLNGYIETTIEFSDKFDVKFIVAKFVENDILYQTISEKHNNSNIYFPVIRTGQIRTGSPYNKNFHYRERNNLILLINKNVYKWVA